MSVNIDCPLCASAAEVEESGHHNYVYRCPVCTVFEVGSLADARLRESSTEWKRPISEQARKTAMSGKKLSIRRAPLPIGQEGYALSAFDFTEIENDASHSEG
jgi:transposase-like protein